MRLVEALLVTGLASADGLQALRAAWSGFNPHEESRCTNWMARTTEAICQLSGQNVEEDQWRDAAFFVGRRWPMPLVELQVEEAAVEIDTLMEERAARHEAEMRWEYGDH